MLLIFGFLNEVFGDNSDSNERYDEEDDNFSLDKLVGRKEDIQNFFNSSIINDTTFKIPKCYQRYDETIKIIGIKEQFLSRIFSESRNIFISNYQLGRKIQYSMKECVEKIIIPNSVKKIDRGAFSFIKKHMYRLENIIIPDSVREIGSNAFRDIPHIEYHGSASGAPWGARSMN